jgi:type IV pilus assembly protein PilE
MECAKEVKQNKRRSIMHRNSKAGFTLIELMVVAIIVAILAAVAIPLMTGNRNRAYATEGQTGCGTIKTCIRIMEAEQAPFPSSLSEVRGVTQADLTGQYFTNYVIASGGAYSNYVVVGYAGNSGASGTLIMTNINNTTTWGGTLLQ